MNAVFRHVPLEPREKGVIDFTRAAAALFCLLWGHVDAALRKVDVTPVQAQNLMLSNSCERSEAKQGNQPGLDFLSDRQEFHKLCGLVNVRLGNLPLNEVHFANRVLVGPPLFQPVVEHSAQLAQALIAVGRSHAGENLLNVVRVDISKNLLVQWLGYLAECVQRELVGGSACLALYESLECLNEWFAGPVLLNCGQDTGP